MKVGGEGDDRRWDGWMTSLTQWTWVWVNSRSWWWTGRPGVLRFIGLQRVRHNWVTELNWAWNHEVYKLLRLVVITLKKDLEIHLNGNVFINSLFLLLYGCTTVYPLIYWQWTEGELSSYWALLYRSATTINV